MSYDAVLADETTADMKVEVLRLPTHAGVDDDILAVKCGNTEGAPDARRPPTSPISLHSDGRGAERERMDHPWGRPMRLAHNAMARLQPLERLHHSRPIGRHQFHNLAMSGAGPVGVAV
jgi:hypothetical protein